MDQVCLLHKAVNDECVACAITWEEFQYVFIDVINEKLWATIIYCECGFAYRAVVPYCTKPGCGILLSDIRGKIEDEFRKQKTKI